MKRFRFLTTLLVLLYASLSANAAESMQWPVVDGFHDPNYIKYTKTHYEAYLKFFADRPHRSGVGPLCEMVMAGEVKEFRSSIDFDHVGTRFHIDHLRKFLRKRIEGAEEFTDDRRPKVSPLEMDVIACVSLIHEAGAVAAIPELAPLLADPHRDVRLYSIWAFQSFGASAGKAVPELIAALETEQAADVAGALAKVGEAAVPALIDKVHMGGIDARIYAAQALGDIGPAAKPAVKVLVAAMQEKQNKTDRAGYISSYAAAALGKIGDPAALPALREAMKTSRNHDVVNTCKTSINMLSED